MSDLLSDLLNNRIQPVPTQGTVNGLLNVSISDDENDFSDESSESDTEQQEYVKKEFDSYFSRPQEVSDGLTDIDDLHEESILGTDIIELVHVPRVFDVYKFDTYYKKELPIDFFKAKILDMINTNSVMIIHGPTGCGKTTQVPQYILDQCKQDKLPCNIVVTQPRRIAAINIAQRVCEERGWAIGTVCGYQVGLDKSAGEDVVLTYVTTEVLLQKLINQKNLNRFTHVIIDEVHERSKALDFLLLIVRKYLFTNSPSVKIILMSATMEANAFAYYFRSIPRNNPDSYLPAPILKVDKKSEYDTNIYYIEQFSPALLTKVDFRIDEPVLTYPQYEACVKLINIFDGLDELENKGGENKNGSVLVFLPGFHEIEEMEKILNSEKASTLQWEVIPLHSSLTSEHMAKAFQKPKPGCRKIILSTNIAESSVTVPDVKYVIDFCLTKIMTTNEVTKFATLSLQWASRNNCIQRAGRVGRVSDGRVYRVVPYEFYKVQMQETTLPELQRAPLENVILYMKLLDLNDTPKNVLSLAISPPNLKDVETCIWHLKEVGALLTKCRGHVTSADGDITFMGRIMGSLPIDIRLSKLIILGHMFSCLEETIIMAAGAMTRNVFIQNYRDRFKCYKKKLLWADGSCSDFMIFLNLYNVWLQTKREHAFRTVNEEIAWCKTNFVNLKGLREWDTLIKEINNRLKKYGIEKQIGVERVKLQSHEKSLILKIIICGAFYPNYFVRSSDFGQVDSKEAVKLINGRDPYNTVYFTNMKVNQPGHIYVRQIKKLLHAENNPNVQIGFDALSTKVYVEYKNFKQPEQVTLDGRQFITTIPGNIGVDIYEAVRKRQLNVPFTLRILPDQKAWAFAESTEEKYKKQCSEEEEVNCFTPLQYSPFPPLDIEYITVTVSHVVDAGHFYCQNWNDETRMILDNIFTALNKPGVFLEPVGPNDKISVDGKLYAARFKSDGKFYRCRIVNITPGNPANAHVQFSDYGNFQRVPVSFIYKLPPDSADCQVKPVAMCCVLSEVQPHLVVNPKGIWSEEVNSIFKTKTERVLLNAKVYSVVDEIVHLELFPQNPGSRNVSFNQWLIEKGYALKVQESERSKMDHDIRQSVLNSENPNLKALSNQVTTAKSYKDYEEPSTSQATEVVNLKGPYSPLEMKVCGLVRASVGNNVRIDGDSVNAVMLDDKPEDPHARLLVAGTVSQSATGNSIKLSQTTILPSVPGLPMLVTLLFCPEMYPKLTPDGCRVASILCGLGYKPNSETPNYAMHDISLVLDTELHADIITKINKIRHFMNDALKTMNLIYDGLKEMTELCYAQLELKRELLNLLHMRQKPVDRVNVKYADVWNKDLCKEVEVLTMKEPNEEDDIWGNLWFVKLNEDKFLEMDVNKNLQELERIAKRLTPEREIECQVCKNGPLKKISDVRIHLFKKEHKLNLAKFKGGERIEDE